MARWLREHKFEAHLTTFLMMIAASVGLYLATAGGATGLIWPLMAVFILANLMAMFIK